MKPVPEYPAVFSTILATSAGVSAEATPLDGPSWRSIMARRASAHGSGMYSCFGSRRRAASSSSCSQLPIMALILALICV